MDLFSQEVLSYEEDKLPTLKQYLKAKGKGKIPSGFLCTLIWVPNKFPSFSLECDKFRLSIPSKSPMGKALVSSIDALIATDSSLIAFLHTTEEGEICPMFKAGNQKGAWDVIGTPAVGYRFVQD